MDEYLDNWKEEYQKRYQENKKTQLALWKNMIIELFGGIPTEVQTITGLDPITNMLQKIGQHDTMNHMFFPSGGGMDLSGTSHSHEEGKILLNCEGLYTLVKPTSLTFHPIGDNPEWWYFRLNTESFEKSGVYEESENPYINGNTDLKPKERRNLEQRWFYNGEQVLEISPCKYVDSSYWSQQNLGYDENGDLIPIPEDARVINRKFNGGDFVIFPKFSVYNKKSETYSAIHNEVNDEAFHNIIRDIVNQRENE